MSAHFAMDEYLIGGLDPEERARASEHLAGGCVECQLDLAKAELRLAVIGLSAPAAAPSPQLKQRIMAELAPASWQLQGGRREGRVWVWSAVTAALVLLSLGLWARISGLDRQREQLRAQVERSQEQLHLALAQISGLRQAAAILSAPATQVMPVRAVPNAPQGRAFLNPQLGAVLIARNLPPAGAGRAYQLWLLPAHGQPLPAGVFEPGKDGTALQVVPHALKDVAGLAVSLEPAAGVAQPTGPIVLAAKRP